jgi:HAE1 family hydrophobic/amphiphilic exporter-1
VVLRNLVSIESGRGPLEIDRKDQQRLTTVYANVAERDLGAVVADVQERLRTVPLPRQYDIQIAGDFEAQQEAFRELMFNFVLAFALVYMVMACLYESLIDPLIVMVSVPFATIGVVVTLLATGTTFNLQTFIGCIMLLGIVVNNAILIVDQAGQLRSAGMTVRQAVRTAGRQRLRPILMTSLTTILALVPLAIGIGEGSEQQAPLARAVIGGLTSSTFITLVLIPVVYSLAHGDRAPTRPQPVEARERADLLDA